MKRILALISGILILAAVFGLWKFQGVNFQAAVLRGYRKVAVKMISHPEPTVLLPVKFHRQEHALSCEAASLKMALFFRGVDVSEKELIEKIGFDTARKQNEIWGDPQKAFVGNINGRMLIDGYGVYNQPIARVANEYRYSIEFNDGKIEDLVRELQNGNPIIVWSYIYSGKPYFWKTPEGKQIKAVYGEHTKIVRGFSGPPENPEGFFLIDPIYGEVYESADKFFEKWAALDSVGVVVYNMAL